MKNTAIKKESYYNKVIEESMALLLDYNLVKFANSGGSIDDLIEYFTETSSSDIVEEYFNNEFIVLEESFNENYEILLEEMECLLESAAAVGSIARGLKWLFKLGIGGTKGGPNIFQRSATSLKNLFKRIKGAKGKNGPQNVNIPPPNRRPNVGNRGRGRQAAGTTSQRSRRNQSAAQRQQRATSTKNKIDNAKNNRMGLRKRDMARLAAIGGAVVGIPLVTREVLKNKNNAPGGGPNEVPDAYYPPPPRPGIDIPAPSGGSSGGSSSTSSGGSSSRSSASQAQPPSRPAEKPSRRSETTSASLPPSLPSPPSDGKSEQMKQWEKANKILAIAAAERKRIRGSSQTDNPLMQDLKSKLPDATPEYQAPEVASLGKGHQSLKDNPNAKKKKAMSEQLQVSKNEAYLIVSDYLISNGHADSIEESFYIAAGMDVNTVMDIVESYYEAASMYNEEGA